MNQLIADWRVKRSREDEQLHQMIRKAVDAEQVHLHIAATPLDFHGSPVHAPWDHLVPLLGLMTLALVVLLATGVAIGIVAMFAGVFGHLYGNRHFVAWRLRKRAIAYLMESALHWQQLWHLGGVALELKGTMEPLCISPHGDWRKFARRNLHGQAAAEPAAAEGEA